MNREKLVSLIVKKETYKDTKQVQNDIAKKKEYKYLFNSEKL